MNKSKKLPAEQSAEDTLLKVLEQTHHRDNYIPKPENAVLKIKDSLIGTLGNFVIFTGLPKAGKGTFLNAMLASTFSEQANHFGLSLNTHYLPIQTIAYFDTESNEDDFYNNINRTKFIARKTIFPDFISMFQFREFASNEIISLIEYYLEKQRPPVIIIDGLLDTIEDFNNIEQSKQRIQWLKRITKQYNCLVIGVIHLGKKENHTLGHFGSMLDRYAQSVMEVSRDYERNIYTIKPKYLRSAKTWFEQINIQWTGNDYEEIFLAPEPKKKRTV